MLMDGALVVGRGGSVSALLAPEVLVGGRPSASRS
jgi:hypothetical protein